MEFGKKQLGNWIITKYEKLTRFNESIGKDEEIMCFEEYGGIPYIRIAPVSGEFAWEYSSMDSMFVMIESAVDDENQHVGLQTCLGIMGSFIHASDPVFYDLYVKCLEVYGDIASERKPTTQEEERAIIDEMKVQYELVEELKKEKEESEEEREERYRQERLISESVRNEGDDTK